MSNIGIDGEITRFFDAFVEAFATFDGKVVAGLFVAPGVALKRDGTLQGFPSHVQTYYQAARPLSRVGLPYLPVLESGNAFSEQQQRHRHRELGPCARRRLWISHWRQAYFIARFANECRIFGSAFVST